MLAGGQRLRCHHDAGPDLFGRGPLRTLGRLIHYRRTGGFQVGFDHDLAVMFIGVAALSPAAGPPPR